MFHAPSPAWARCGRDWSAARRTAAARLRHGSMTAGLDRRNSIRACGASWSVPVARKFLSNFRRPPERTLLQPKGVCTMTDRVEINPNVMQGKPVIRGTRIPGCDGSCAGGEPDTPDPGQGFRLACIRRPRRFARRDPDQIPGLCQRVACGSGCEPGARARLKTGGSICSSTAWGGRYQFRTSRRAMK